MRKFLALMYNEWYKITHQTMTWIFIGLMILGLAASLFFMDLQDGGSSSFQSEDDPEALAQQAEEIRSIKEDIEDLQQQKKAPASSDEIVASVEEIDDLIASKTQFLQMLETYQQRGIYMRYGFNDLFSDWINGHLRSTELGRHGAPVLDAEDFRTILESVGASKEASLKVYQNVLEKIAPQNDLEQRWIQHRLETLAVVQKLLEKRPDWTQEDARALSEQFEVMENEQNSLENGFIAGPTHLAVVIGSQITPSMQKELEANIKATQEKIERDIFLLRPEQKNFDQAIKELTNPPMNLLFLFLLISAGGAISNEMATGTIKSLVISPTKRYKIYWAKLCAMVLLGLLGILAITGIIYLLAGLRCGFHPHEFLYLQGDHYTVLPHFGKVLLENLLFGFDALCLLVFAYSLSSFFKNTALAVAFSIAGFLGGPFVGILAFQAPTRVMMWLLPYFHMSLFDRIFPVPIMGAFSAMFKTPYYALGVQPSAWYTAIYLIGVFVALLWVGRDAFCRRDIK